MEKNVVVVLTSVSLARVSVENGIDNRDQMMSSLVHIEHKVLHRVFLWNVYCRNLKSGCRLLVSHHLAAFSIFISSFLFCSLWLSSSENHIFQLSVVPCFGFIIRCVLNSCGVVVHLTLVLSWGHSDPKLNLLPSKYVFYSSNGLKIMGVVRYYALHD